MRYVAMDDYFAVRDLAEALITAGYSEKATIDDLRYDRVDGERRVLLDFQIDAEELVKEASSDTLQRQLDGMGGGGATDLADAVRALLSGDRVLARVLFERVLGPAQMLGIERVLRP